MCIGKHNHIHSSFISGVFFYFFSFLPSLSFSQVRKFVSKDSAGLRVRSHPSLQSDQIGVVHVNGTITFIDEVIDWRDTITVSRIKKLLAFFHNIKKVWQFTLFCTVANASLI